MTITLVLTSVEIEAFQYSEVSQIGLCNGNYDNNLVLHHNDNLDS